MFRVEGEGMDVLMVAAIGVVIVLVSILLLRLHPLLGLLIASLFVFAATPRSILLNTELKSKQVEIVDFAAGGLVGLDSATARAGKYYFLRDLQSGIEDPPGLVLERATHAQLLESVEQGGLSVAAQAWFTAQQGGPVLGRQDRLVSAADVAEFDAARWKGIGAKLADGFAKTFHKLGIPVTMAAIVGVCLLESGAAARLVAAIMSLFGARGTAPSLTVSGFILGVPVFFDNVFYLLLPLAKAVGRQRPEGYLAAVMAIIVGATMAHSLVPPTPGPLLVAETLNVSVGMMMMGGLVVGGIASCIGFAYGMLCTRWIQLSPETSTAGPTARHTDRPVPLLLAALPIAVPMAILGGSEVVAYMAESRGPSSRFAGLREWMEIVNDPGLIFIATALLSIALLRYYTTRAVVGQSLTRGIADAGTIVLLTCAGGAFGASLQQLDLANAIGSRFAGLTTPWGVLFTAFCLTTIIRAAQGSATVAMITSGSIVAPVIATIDLPFHPLYVALAIGCGSKPLPWMNDSGFWQVATMTGMTTGQTLKTFSVALTLMGVTGFAVTLLGAWLIPLI